METINSLAFFPLSLFKMPGETIELHIFENRYQQLIQEMLDEEIEYFGIPASFPNGKQAEFGGLAKIQKLHRRYPDGRFDVRVEIIDLIEVLSFEQQLGDKLYAGGDVKRLHFQPRLIDNHQLLFQFKELCTKYPGLFKSEIHEELTDADLIRLLPITDSVKLIYAKLPPKPHIQDDYLRYQMDRIQLLIIQEAAVHKSICFN
jgi:Lon protease-like protein